MKKSNIDYVGINGNISIPVKIGSVTFDEIYQFWIGRYTQRMIDNYKDKEFSKTIAVGDIYVDIDHVDTENFQYEGVDIGGYSQLSKFKDFHKENLGIDYDVLSHNYIVKEGLMPTKEQVLKLIPQEVIDFIK